MKKIILTKTLLFVVFFASFYPLQAHTNFTVLPDVVSHEIFDNLLKKYVTDIGKVDYEGFKSEEAKLKTYLDILATTAPSANWTRDDQIAYWINAYNAHAIYMVAQAYPISSIIKINGGKVFSSPLKIGGQLVTLSEIENKILMGKFYEPRIHFAINNTAKSSPPLMAKAWTGESLNLDLNQRTYGFINNKKHNQIEAASSKISKIFQWNAKDFREIKTYINQYSPINISSNAEIKYFEYDWSLNKKV